MITRPKSSMPNKRFSNKLKLETNTKMNSKDNISLNQSPKISSGKYRSLFDNKSSFSLIDINDKVTIDKGPSLPIQFKRLSSKEIKALFNMKILDNYKKIKKLKYSSMKNILLDKMNKPNTTKHQDNNKIYLRNKQKLENANKSEIGKNTERKMSRKNSIFSEDDIKDINNRKELFNKRPQTCRANMIRINFKKMEEKKEERKEKEKSYIKRDIWKPLYYEAYEEMVKNKKIYIKKMQENPFFKRLPQCSIKEIKEKTHNSDIFFLKQKEVEKFDLEMQKRDKKGEKYNLYYDSDIFNIKNNDVNLEKIGEKYLFNNPNNIKYTTAIESKSDWKNSINNITINTCSSKPYNILTPQRKNSFLIRSDIYKLLDGKKHSQNPLFKQKGLSKYLDVANNSSCNFGEEYLKFYKANPNCFKKIKETCCCFGDLYLRYKNICDEPFHKINNINE